MAERGERREVERREGEGVKEGGGVRGLAESHQALKRAVELRAVVIGRRELYGSREAWTSHQQLAAPVGVPVGVGVANTDSD